MSRGFGWKVMIVWLCFLVRGAFYSTLLPLWEGYDEYSHFSYIQYLNQRGSLPRPGLSHNSLEVSASLTQSPMPWTFREIPGSMTYDAFWKLSPAERARRTAPLRMPADLAARAEDPQGQSLYESQQPPLYYWLMAPVLIVAEHWSLASRVFLIRIASLFLCSFALPLGFATARRVLGSDAAALGVIALVACMPGAVIDFARAGNESLCLLVYTALLYFCVRLLDEGANWRNSVMIGIVLGCGLLSKAFFLTAIPVVALAFALAPRSGVRFAAATLAIASAIGGWWYRFIHAVTGDFTGQIQSVSVQSVPIVERLRAALGVNWLRALDSTLFSHIWFGGWSFLQIRSWMYHLFYAVFALAVIGLIRFALRRPKRFANERALCLLASFEAFFFASLAYQVTIAQIVYRKPMSAGWYLYCLIFAEAILLCAGLMSLLPADRRMWAPVALTGLFGLLDLYGVNFILLPYYLGLNAHNAAGRLPAFQLSQARRIGLPELDARAVLNAPYLHSPAAFYALWTLYVATTIACVWMVIDVRRRQH